MKRSEMLELIREHLLGNTLTSPRDSKEEAEELLRLIEQAGMLPPSIPTIHGLINDWNDEGID